MKKIILALIISLALSGCTFKIKELENVKPKVEQLEKASDFKISETENLLDKKDKNTLVIFWATWCPSCVTELPQVQELLNEGNENLRIITVNVTGYEKEGKVAVEKFMKDNKYTFDVVYDEDGSISQLYNIRYIPANYVIDKEGNIKAKLEQFEKEKVLELIK